MYRSMPASTPPAAAATASAAAARHHHAQSTSSISHHPNNSRSAFIKSALVDLGLSLISVVLSVAVVHLLFESRWLNLGGRFSSVTGGSAGRGVGGAAGGNGMAGHDNGLGGAHSGKPNKNAHAQRARLLKQSVGPGGTTEALSEVQRRRAEAVFDEWEDEVAADMVFPEDIIGGFDLIGGLEKEKQSIYELITLPMRRPDLFRTHSLVAPPKGVLLYGPPGTGKSLIARAIAKESGACFIDFKMSSIMSMWFGESQKLIRATFSLARKLSPAVIFIDEIDSFLRKRRGDDHPAYENMKAEFMSLWDGLASEVEGDGRDYGVIVVGATNRPFDLDPAILRRLPRTFEIRMPGAKERSEILKVILKDENVTETLRDSLDELATTELLGYSGSDIKELCRAAAGKPLREVVVKGAELRAISLTDFKEALTEVRPSGETAREYLVGQQQQQGEDDHTSTASAQAAAQAAAMMAADTVHNNTEQSGESSVAFLEGMKRGYAIAVMGFMAAGRGDVPVVGSDQQTRHGGHNGGGGGGMEFGQNFVQ